LKILLSQQGLDKPFTGGLGSYALYVLVANHIERHLALGGDDNPAEALYTFFFRYGGVQHSNSKIPSSSRTVLSQTAIIETQDGGSADMKSCFQIENCISIFEACWRMLQKRLKGAFNQKSSIVQYMIDAAKLELGRSQTKKQADMKLREVFGEKIIVDDKKINPSLTRAILEIRREEKSASLDEEAQELIEGYGQKVETFMPVEETHHKRKRKPRKNRRKQKKKKNLQKENKEKV